MKRFSPFILVLFFPLFIISPLMAQGNASISGYIKDKQSGETLILANVAIENTTLGASSNTSGYYTITDLKPGTYTILCSYIGYKKFTKTITLAPDQHLRLDIALSPVNLRLQDIIVESKAEKDDNRNIGTTNVSTKLIKQIPSVLEADVFRSIQLLPGVKSASDFSSGLYIRGGSPDQTLILLDGTTVYNPTHFFGFFSTFNPDAIKNVRLYKGGYPAKYGGRLGSVLAIYNKDGNRNKTEGTVSLGLLASRASIEGPYSKKGSYMLAFRRSTLEPVLAILRQSIDNIPTKFYFWDLNGKINMDATKNNKFSLAFYSGEDNVAFPFATDAQINLQYGNRTFSSKWTHIFSQKVFSNLTVTGSHYFNYPSFNIASTPFKRTNLVYDASARGDLQYIPNSHHNVETGFWSGILTLKLKDHFNGQNVFSSRILSRYASVYLQDTWTPTEKWKFVGGIRLNTFSKGNYTRLAPRISAEYKASDKIRLQAAYGRYDQYLTLVSNQAFSGFDTWLTTGPGVPPSWGDQFVLGTKTSPFKNIEFDVESYYRTMNELFELNPFLPDASGLNYNQIFRFGSGYAYGIEFTLSKSVGRLNGYLGYTFSVTRRKFPNFNLDRFYPPKYDRENDIKLILNYQLSQQWKVTSVFDYATGQAYTRPLGRTVVNTPFNVNGDQVFTVGRVNASRLPAYNRLDFGFSRTGTFFGRGSAEWQFQIINVYSHRNVWFYSYDFNKNPIKQNTVYMLPIIPSISYTLKF